MVSFIEYVPYGQTINKVLFGSNAAFEGGSEKEEA